MDFQRAISDITGLDLTFTFSNLHVDTKWITIVPDNTPWVYSRHVHSSYEFHILAKGRCYVTVGDKSFEVKKGQFYIVPPGVFHSQESDKNDIAVEYGLNCDIFMDFKGITRKPAEMDYIIALLNYPEHQAFEDTERVIETFDNIIYEINQKPVGYEANIKLYLYQLILYCARVIGKLKELPFEYPVRDIDNRRMLKIQEFIEDNLCANITLQEIAGILYLSEKQVNRIVQKIKGKSVHQYIIDTKLEKAKCMLQDEYLKVTDIAEALGFSTSNHFSNTFKNKVGISPQEFRNNLVKR